jgi:hypothetical protein
MTKSFEPVVRVGKGLEFRNGHWLAAFEAGTLTINGIRLEPAVVLAQNGDRVAITTSEVAVAIDDGLIARIVATGVSPQGHVLRITYDVHQTANLHVYLRLEWGCSVELDAVQLPLLRVGSVARVVAAAGERSLAEPARLPLREPWFQLLGDAVLGVGITKLPWASCWNDVGATGYHTLANISLVSVPGDGLALAATGSHAADAGDTLETSLFLRPVDEPAAQLRYEATHEDPRELIYLPAAEWDQFTSREIEDRWLGPPIMGGCQNRPADQLIPRSLGMDILARRRFSWNNEDLSLWRITGKDIYRDIAVKKAYGLLAAQNEYGGWFEGVEFYNLPPRHHQHYHSYTSFVFLIDLYDVTGHQPFLDAALRSKEFWFGDPPANSHSVDAPDAWWYRWGGYINSAGYTDERHALNTHASVLMIFSLLWTRLHDAEAMRGMEYGVNAFKRALEVGLQRENGQFLYSLSQIDPRLERPGDPQYLQTNLIPEIEDVYTVLSSFRLMIANRVANDHVIRDSCARALNYFWAAHLAGTAYTYRSYAVKTFGVGAGEIDLRYAFSLPHLLKDPDNWTAIYKGFSAWVAPHEHKGLLIDVEGRSPAVESVFLSRTSDAFTFALVNTGAPRSRLPVRVEVDDAAVGSTPRLIDPADGTTSMTLPSSEEDRMLEFEIPSLPEESVAVVRLVAAGSG